MATFFLFGKYTHEAIKEISADRTARGAAVIKENGGVIKDGYALLGDIDLILIVDFPGVEQAMKASVNLSKLLGISFTTSPAVSVEEFDKLVG
jgi:uncharacterized protein with GYD domain